MADDLPIHELLVGLGFVGTAEERARAVLEEAGLTRPGKTRIAASKEARVLDLLGSRLARLCGHTGCAAGARGREAVRVPKTACEMCGGSSTRRASGLAGEALRREGVRRVLVLGGSPATQRALTDALENEGLTVRCVDGTAGARPAATVAADLAWAQVLVVWASTPLAHKVSQPYTSQAPRDLRVITVPRRGVEAVCLALARVEG